MKSPLVSIGMPIRNEEGYIGKSLDSILRQHYPNIEIIISDNASSDSTGDVCQEYAAIHDKIKYVRLQENIGSAANFQSVFENAKGKYFMWAAGHDLWSDNLIAEAVELLENDESVVLAFGTNYWIDGSDNILKKQTGWSDTRGLDAFARYFITFWGAMNPILSVMKADSLRKCGGFKSIVGSDLVVLTALSLEGAFAHTTNASWYRREFRNETEYKEKIKRYVSKDYGQVQGVLDKFFPLARLPFYLLQNILRSGLTFSEKTLLSATVMLSMPAKFFSGYRQNKQ